MGLWSTTTIEMGVIEKYFTQSVAIKYLISNFTQGCKEMHKNNIQGVPQKMIPCFGGL